jgi:hypothetical protein
MTPPLLPAPLTCTRCCQPVDEHAAQPTPPSTMLTCEDGEPGAFVFPPLTQDGWEEDRNQEVRKQLRRFSEDVIRLMSERDAARAEKAVLMREVERLRTQLHGHALWTGPCAHGRDPWDRCGMCGQGTVVEALHAAWAALTRERDEALVVLADVLGIWSWDASQDNAEQCDELYARASALLARRGGTT